MNPAIFLIVCSIFWISLSAFILPATNSSTLKLLHVIFRHGDRNPDLGNLIPGSPYFNESNYLEGYGQLTNAGKRTEYRLGKLLRQKYDTFLTDEWNINFIEARSTDTNRTKMSLELVLAGLYPPKLNQIWSEDDDIPWQPIPYNYVPITEDKEMLFNIACPKYTDLLYAILESSEISSYINKRYKEIFNTLSEKTRQQTTISDAFMYNFAFLILQELGYPLEDWVDSLYPELYSATVDMYYLVTNTTKIRRLVAGFALKKILDDSKAKIEDERNNPSNRKLFLYSAHELNIATILLALDAFKITQIPPYGSYLVFEIHEVVGIWGIKLFYQNYSNIRNYEPVPIKIPGCNYFCPFETFSELVAEILPDSDNECFYQSVI